MSSKENNKSLTNPADALSIAAHYTFGTVAAGFIGLACVEEKQGVGMDDSKKSDTLAFPEPKPELRTNPATGSQYIARPLRRRQVMPLKMFVENLRAFNFGDGHFLFEMVSNTPLDETDARDAQDRAGWSEYRYGFNDFECKQIDGVWFAKWTCYGTSLD